MAGEAAGLENELRIQNNLSLLTGGSEQSFGLQTRLPAPAEDLSNFYLSGLGASIVSGATREFVGLDPTAEAVAFRGKHPKVGFTTGIAGFMVPAIATSLGLSLVTGPLGGTAAAASKLPLLGKMLQALKASEVAKKSIAFRGGLNLTTLTAAEESVRLTLAAAVGDPVRVAKEIPINLLGSAVLGAGVAKLGGLISPAQHSQAEAVVFNNSEGFYDIAAPLQMRARQLHELETLEKASPEPREFFLEAIKRSLKGNGTKEERGLLDQIRRDLPIKGQEAHITSLDQNIETRAMNELMVPTSVRAKAGFSVKQLIKGKNGFSGKDPEGAIQSVYQRAGITEQLEPYMKHPRQTKITEGAEGAKARSVIGDMQKAEDNLFWVKQSDGLYVFAKRIDAGADELLDIQRLENLAPENLLGELAGIIERAAPRQLTEIEVFSKKLARLGAKDTVERAELEKLIVNEMLRKKPLKPQFIKPEVAVPREYLMWKTDSPGLFASTQEAWSMETIEKLWQTAAEVASDVALRKSIPLGRRWDQLQQVYSPIGAPLTAKVAKARAAHGKIKEIMTPETLDRIENVFKYNQTEVKNILSPLITLFSDFAPAVTMAAKARAMFDFGDAQSTLEFAGRRPLDAKATPLSTVFGSTDTLRGGVRDPIRRMSDTETGVLQNRLLIEGIQDRTEQQLIEAGYSPNVAATAKRLEALGETKGIEMEQVAELTGFNSKFKKRTDHLLLSHTWRGDLRLAVLNKDDDIVAGFASGHSEKEILAEAASIIEESGGAFRIKKGKELDIFQAGRDETSAILSQIETPYNSSQGQLFRDALLRTRAKTPLVLRERKGLVGFSKNLTTRELENKVFGHLKSINRTMSQHLAQHGLKGDLAWLSRVRPRMAEQLNQRINAMGGATGPLSQAQNKFVDAALRPVLNTRDSATKIVGAVNGMMHFLTLGALDVGFPALNAVTFLQTVLPEVSMVLSASDGKLAELYGNAIVTRGAEALPISFLDPARITAKAMKMMRSNDPELMTWINRAIDEGTINPRFAEEFLGELNENVRFRHVLDGDEGFVDWLKSINSFMPAKSEEFARTHAFIVGKLVGEMMGVTGDKGFRLASEFTNRTMYLYAQPMRAKAMTGPIGNMFGLFKNWQFHYLGNMAHYGEEGIARGNWNPMLWSMMGTGSIAGLGGVPLFAAADGFSRMATDASLMTNLYDWSGYAEGGVVSRAATDALYYGLPAFGDIVGAGLSMQSRGAAPTSDPIRDITGLFEMASFDRLGRINDVFFEAWKTFADTGQHPAQNDRLWGMATRAFGPRTLYRGMQTVYTEGLQNLETGNLTIAKLNTFQKMAHTFGISPLEEAQHYDRAAEVNRNAKSRNRQIQTFGEAEAQAIQDKDWKLFRRLKRDERLLGVPTDSVARSREARLIKRAPGTDSLSRQSDFRTRLEQRRIFGD